MTLPKDLTTLSQGELIRIIYDQQDKIEALEIRLAEIQERLNDQGPKQPPLPSWVKPSVKSKKNGKRQNRGYGYARKLDTPTKHIFHSYDHCPNCDGRLGKPSVGYTRQVIELPETPVEVTEHVVCKRWCSTCQKRVMPRVDFSSLVVGQQRIGIRLMSIIGMLKDVCRQPLAVIQAYLELVHGLHLSEGALVKLLHRTAEKGKPTYDDLLAHLRRSPHIHADETGGRENGKNGYHWSFSSSDVHFLLYRKSRSKQIVEEILGDQFEGVLSTDFYTAYNTYNGFHQRCWVHLLRDMHDVQEEYPDDPEVNQWVNRVTAIYEEAKAYGGPPSLLQPGEKEQERVAKQAYFEKKLRAICLPWVGTKTPMRKLSSRMLTYLQELFVFIRFEGIPSDNNGAERILRHTVVQRKISGGTRSSKGSETRSILSSLFSTWRLQGKNPLQECQLLLATCQ